MLERQRFADVSPSRVDARSIGPPVCEAVLAELSDNIQSFSRTDVPFPAFLDLRENPGLYQSATSDHNAVNITCFHAFPITLRRIRIATTKYWYRWQSFLGFRRTEYVNALLDVSPVRQLGVTLLACSTVDGHCTDTPFV